MIFPSIKGKPCFLDLGEVHTVAEVKVNGKQAGTLMYSPYKLDISGYLKQGENIIEIKVTPRTMNRYIGFGLAYKNTTGAEQKTYQYYKEVSEVSTGWGGNSSSNYVDAGLLGPVCSIILKFIISLIFTGKNLYGL